jgi:hypothetical protein
MMTSLNSKPKKIKKRERNLLEKMKMRKKMTVKKLQLQLRLITQNLSLLLERTLKFKPLILILNSTKSETLN